MLVLRSILLLSTLCILLLATVADAQPAPSKHDGFFADHVKNGVVDYTALKKDKRLAAYVKEISAFPLSRARMTPEATMAFWINAYNAFTLKLICDNWPLKSIMDLDGGKVWDRKWIVIDGRTYSLNQIEHEIIRPMGDPRIHFALVCAAKSCPPLRSEPYSANDLDEQLDDQGKTFISTSSLNRLSAADQQARLSQIFEWYGKDFGPKQADLIRALAPYAPSAARSSMKAAPSGWKVSYLPYDWSVNGK